MFQLYNNIFVILMTEFIDCIHNTRPSNYFSVEFLNNSLFKILPEGYDVCYMVKRTDDYLGGYFYLYDSTRPMNIYDSDYVLGVVEFYIDLEEDELNIPMLRTNSDLDGFDMTRGGIGTYLLLCIIAYAKSFDIFTAKLEDMSDGYRTPNNIYEKLGFVYEDEDSGPEMIGLVNDIYNKIDDFIMSRGERFVSKLNSLTEYFDDEEWEMELE